MSVLCKNSFQCKIRHKTCRNSRNQLNFVDSEQIHAKIRRKFESFGREMHFRVHFQYSAAGCNLAVDLGDSGEGHKSGGGGVPKHTAFEIIWRLRFRLLKLEKDVLLWTYVINFSCVCRNSLACAHLIHLKIISFFCAQTINLSPF